jgi:hypothetical protein
MRPIPEAIAPPRLPVAINVTIRDIRAAQAKENFNFGADFFVRIQEKMKMAATPHPKARPFWFRLRTVNRPSTETLVHGDPKLVMSDIMT